MTEEQRRTAEPGRTPGQAEGERTQTADEREATRVPGRTGGQAEGDRDTVEQSLREHEQKGDANA